MEVCHEMYKRQPTYLAPEFVKIGRDMEVHTTITIIYYHTTILLYYCSIVPRA